MMYKLKNTMARRFSIQAILLGLLLLAATHGLVASQMVTTISPKNAATLITQQKGNPAFVILDIRTPSEYSKGHLAKSILIDYYSKSFAHRLNKLDKNKTYLVYCRSGNRSGRALSIFKSMGFKNVYNMDQGINGWRRAGYSTVQ